MEIKRSSNNLNVVDSGAVISFDSSSDVNLDIDCGPSFKFSVKFTFETTGAEEHDIQQSIVGNTIIFNCLDCNNSIGVGTTEPIELATYGEKRIFINFWVYDLSNGALKKLEYTVYTEK